MNFQLKDFDGPLDLLLTLIGKAQIDIRDIFISNITDQYLEIVREAADLNMDEASDFLVMAATLVEIKSRALLPRKPETEEEQEAFLRGYQQIAPCNRNAIHYYMAQCYVYFLQFSGDDAEYCDYIRNWLKRYFSSPSFRYSHGT